MRHNAKVGEVGSLSRPHSAIFLESLLSPRYTISTTGLFDVGGGRAAGTFRENLS